MKTKPLLKKEYSVNWKPYFKKKDVEQALLALNKEIDELQAEKKQGSTFGGWAYVDVKTVRELMAKHLGEVKP